MSAQPAPVLQFVNIGKRFPGVVALQDVDLDLNPGEIHALLGENGAGKSTLIKILAGIQPPDDGSISMGGREVTIATPKEAQRLGISLVPQDVLIVPELSIGRNILLGLESFMARRGALSARERATVDAALAKVGAHYDPETPARALSVPHLRLAQIARALIQSTDIMVLDEPTAVLSEPDANHLLERLQHFRDEGRAILYVTHRLSEVMRMADRMTILRDGRRVGVYRRGEVTRDDIVRLMTKDIAHSRPSGIRPAARPAEAGPARLTVRGLSAEPRFETIDLDAHAGRIVGIAGVQGSGHGAFVRAVGGLDPVDTGTVSVEGRKMVAGSARRSVQHGILTVPADRRGAAIVPPMSVRGNLALSDRIREKARRWGLRWRRVERDMIQGYIRDLDIRPPNGETRIANLSGGNQQKVALARVLEGSASVLLVEEPTQGIDVGAKAEIHELLRRVARDTNCAVVIATSEFEELIGLADDIYVMRSGRMVKHIPGPEATYHAILESALP